MGRDIRQFKRDAVVVGEGGVELSDEIGWGDVWERGWGGSGDDRGGMFVHEVNELRERVGLFKMGKWDNGICVTGLSASG